MHGIEEAEKVVTVFGQVIDDILMEINSIEYQEVARHWRAVTVLEFEKWLLHLVTLFWFMFWSVKTQVAEFGM